MPTQGELRAPPAPTHAAACQSAPAHPPQTPSHPHPPHKPRSFLSKVEKLVALMMTSPALFASTAPSTAQLAEFRRTLLTHAPLLKTAHEHAKAKVAGGLLKAAPRNAAEQRAPSRRPKRAKEDAIAPGATPDAKQARDGGKENPPDGSNGPTKPKADTPKANLASRFGTAVTDEGPALGEMTLLGQHQSFSTQLATLNTELAETRERASRLQATLDQVTLAGDIAAKRAVSDAETIAVLNAKLAEQSIAGARAESQVPHLKATISDLQERFSYIQAVLFAQMGINAQTVNSLQQPPPPPPPPPPPVPL